MGTHRMHQITVPPQVRPPVQLGNPIGETSRRGQEMNSPTRTAFQPRLTAVALLGWLGTLADLDRLATCRLDRL